MYPRNTLKDFRRASSLQNDNAQKWFINHRIEKKSMPGRRTSRIPKVTETSEIVNTINDNSDRFDEFITVYQRGVNPLHKYTFSNLNAGPNGLGTSFNAGQATSDVHKLSDVFRLKTDEQVAMLPIGERVKVCAKTNYHSLNYRASQPNVATVGRDAKIKVDSAVLHPEISVPTSFIYESQPNMIESDIYNSIQPLLPIDSYDAPRSMSNAKQVSWVNMNDDSNIKNNKIMSTNITTSRSMGNAAGDTGMIYDNSKMYKLGRTMPAFESRSNLGGVSNNVWYPQEVTTKVNNGVRLNVLDNERYGSRSL